MTSPTVMFQTGSDMPEETNHARMTSRYMTRRPTVGLFSDLACSKSLMEASLEGRLGVMTCGGICSGMNAAIRAVVRLGMHLVCDVIYIYHGVQGLVEGGEENFKQATLSSTLGEIARGGTFINSSEGYEFFDRKAKLRAALNLIENNLSRIVIIGCEETMDVMFNFHKEWPSLLTELSDKEMVDPGKAMAFEVLNIAIVAASVTNNVCGTDKCIGYDTAMHRIIEATDALSTTSASAKQAFVVEVMGDTCGYLALACCVAASGTMAFIPEWPPHGDWREELKAKIKEDFCQGVNHILIMVASGATDKDRQPIKASDINNILVNELKLKTSVTVLGQVQRGGHPSAFDRLLAARLGAEAVMALFNREDMFGPCVLGMVGNEVICATLTDVVERNRRLVLSLKTGDFAMAVKLRGKRFQNLLSAYNTLHRLQPSPLLQIPNLKGVPQIAIIRSGRYSIAQCIVIKCIVGQCASRGVRVLGVTDGFSGLSPLNVVTLTWDKVMQWNGNTADCLRSSRTLPETVGMDKVASAFRKMQIAGLILLGSFHAFDALHQMWNAQSKYEELCIPMCFVPVTILNNIPGSDYTIGCDSAINENVEYCEKMKRVARSQTDSVIVVETMGHMCGYITTITAICVGAEMAYIRNEDFNIKTMLQDVESVKRKFKTDGMRLTLILHSENANENYNSEFTHKLFSEEGKGIFVCRHEKIGHVQIGVTPSPKDRISATLFGLEASNWLVDKIENLIGPNGTVYTTDNAHKVVLCQRRHSVFNTIAHLAAETDFQTKLPTYMWWKKLRNLMRILSRMEEQGNYEVEARPYLFGKLSP